MARRQLEQPFIERTTSAEPSNRNIGVSKFGGGEVRGYIPRIRVITGVATTFDGSRYSEISRRQARDDHT